MADPKMQFFGQIGMPTVWSVDDAWFEGANDYSPVIPDVIALEKGDSSVEELKCTIEKKENDAVPWGDLLLLKHLVSLSFEYKFNLVLCNFEYFEKNFIEAINPRNAVLMDINYDKAEQDKNNYGVHLLAKVLQGNRPNGDVFFVTSYRESL